MVQVWFHPTRRLRPALQGSTDFCATTAERERLRPQGPANGLGISFGRARAASLPQPTARCVRGPGRRGALTALPTTFRRQSLAPFAAAGLPSATGRLNGWHQGADAITRPCVRRARSPSTPPCLQCSPRPSTVRNVTPPAAPSRQALNAHARQDGQRLPPKVRRCHERGQSLSERHDQTPTMTSEALITA